MLVEQQVAEGDADEVQGKDEVPVGDVTTAEGAAEGVVSVADDVVPTANEELIERMIAEIDTDADVVIEEDKEFANVVKDVQDAESARDQGRKAESQVKIYKIDMGHANKYLSMQEDESEPDEVQEIAEVVTTAKIITKVVTAASDTITAASTTIFAADAQVPAVTLTAAPSRVTAAPSKRRKVVAIRDPQETETSSTIIPAKTKSKDKEAELNKNIDWDEVTDHVQRKQKEDKDVKRYQALKRKPRTKAQARKNMIVYLKNVAGFKMGYFKGMSYDDIRPIFKAKFNVIVAFLQKTKEQIEEEESRALKRLNETLAEKAERGKSWMRREDLEALWRLVKERFSTTKPKNFSDDFLLTVLGAMFEKPDIHAQIWKNQRSVHDQAKIKSWKLLESRRVQIIRFTTTQLILLVERKYPLTKFTLNQMLNNVRLEVKEESEVSLRLLRFIRQQHQEGAQGRIVGLYYVLISLCVNNASFGVDAAMDLKKNMLSV
nr:hypothetical protein [Tanacetum cinerariifolium]